MKNEELSNYIEELEQAESKMREEHEASRSALEGRHNEEKKQLMS